MVVIAHKLNDPVRSQPTSGGCGGGGGDDVVVVASF